MNNAKEMMLALENQVNVINATFGALRNFKQNHKEIAIKLRQEGISDDIKKALEDEDKLLNGKRAELRENLANELKKAKKIINMMCSVKDYLEGHYYGQMLAYAERYGFKQNRIKQHMKHAKIV